VVVAPGLLMQHGGERMFVYQRFLCGHYLYEIDRTR